MAQNDLTDPQSFPRVGAILQARIGSTRLPGKALLPLPLGGSGTLLEQIIARARRATLVAEVVVALPDSAADLPLLQLTEELGIRTLQGSETDVLSRFNAAAEHFGFAVIVRLTADNPALDPLFIDEAVRAHLAAGADYTITTGLPLGMNIEVVSASALLQAHLEATAPADREHVTPYLRQRPEQFQLLTLALATATPQAAGLRLTVDYPSDYALLHVLYSTLGPDFSLADILALTRRYPWLATVNAANPQVHI
ncbi:MAG: glycosyltransferase family protein [Hymenobacteraceae bacterium]|nr:glycosyltransferase family protein [Hymenobacteraceae bacterium]